MRKLFTTFLLFTIAIKSIAQNDSSKYDKHLADSLGADEYGMKTYILVILKTGPAKVEDSKKRDSIFHGHLQNIKHLAALGKLIVAGPFYKNENHYEGIFILNVNTTEAANQLLQTDPAVQAKLLDTELYKWYGSAALPEYLQYYERITKKQF